MPTIIVASDAPSLRKAVISALSEPGREFVEINDGRKVTAAVDEHKPDLVIADLQMGSMGAMAVCLELRLEESYGRLPHVPFLMLLDRRADVFLARRSGAEGWLIKPIDPLRLAKAVKAMLAGETFHDESYRPEPVVESPLARHALGVSSVGEEGSSLAEGAIQATSSVSGSR